MSGYRVISRLVFIFLIEITVQAIEAFVPQMFRRFYIDALMYGNLTEDVCFAQ